MQKTKKTERMIEIQGSFVVFFRCKMFFVQLLSPGVFLRETINSLALEESPIRNEEGKSGLVQL